MYYEEFVGGRPEVNAQEDELTKLNRSGFRQRRLREMIEAGNHAGTLA